MSVPSREFGEEAAFDKAFQFLIHGQVERSQESPQLGCVAGIPAAHVVRG